jgi:hypothetical protein
VNRTDYDDFTLYLADMQERQIINTCLQVGRGTAFSPNNTKLAFLAPGTGTKLVYVLDLESWALHPVANHIVENNDGAVIGWREQ